MTGKPTYEQLEKRVEALEKESLARRAAEQALRKSEIQKRTILDASLDRIIQVDKNLEIVWVNRATSKALGFSLEEIVGKRCFTLMAGRSAPCRECPAVRSMKTGFVERTRLSIRKTGASHVKDGQWEICAIPLKDDKGRIENFMLVEKDSSDLRHTLDRLKEREETLDAILSASSVGIGLVRNRRLDWANRAMYEMVGYEEGSLLGESASILYPGPDEFESAGLQLYRNLEGEIAHVETRWVRKDGKIIDCFLRGRPLDPFNPEKGVIVAATDITELKNAEKALKESERRHREVVENATEAILVAQDGAPKFFNKKVLEITGYSEEEYASQRFDEVIHPADRPMVLERHFKRLDGENLPSIYPFRIIDKRGNEKWVEIKTVLIPWEGRPATLNFLSDITARKHAEEALVEREKALRAILEASPIGISHVQNRTIRWMNKAFCEMVGYEEGSLSDQGVRVLYPVGEEYDRVGRVLYDPTSGGGPVGAETRWVRKDGKMIDCCLRASPLDADDLSKGVIVAAMDLTEQKHAEGMLRESEKELRSLSSRLLTAQEEERRRIARDLHDTIVQNLAFIKLSLNMKLKQMNGPAPASGVSLENVVSAVKDCIEEVRGIIENLRPPLLDNLGIVSAISSHCRSFQALHPSIRINEKFDVREEEISDALKIVIFRILQEALNNIANHSRARSVDVSLKKTEGRIELMISDDGVGFDPGRIRSRNRKRIGFGLTTMKERAELSGGLFSIATERERGTRITASWPT